MRCFFAVLSLTVHLSPLTSWAGQWPSLFRGVVVADGALGIRVVSVEDASQASLADLRPEDTIVRINDASIKTVDDFAVVSQALKGRTARSTLLILRNGQPRELVVSLYSDALLRQWEVSFIPEHDVRFGEPKTGLAYWMRMERGFEAAGDLEAALNADLNALHQDPAQLDVAVKACELSWRIARARLEDRRLPEALTAIQQGTILLGHMFDQSLEASQLQSLKSQLQETLAILRETKHVFSTP